VIAKEPSNVKAHFYIGKVFAKESSTNIAKQSDAILHFE
jgi:hypothetical protein